jgi:hypothetical protein
LKLHNKEDGFEWCLLVVYGVAQDNEKENFLNKLVRMCGTENIPLMVRGDFNIIQSPSEKTIANIMIDGSPYLTLS